MPLYFGKATPYVAGYSQEDYFDAQADFGFVGDLVSVFDGGASTAANTTITSATAAFTTNAYVGQRVTLAGADAAGVVYVGTITAINSATSIAVTPAIATTVASAGLQFGTDNTTAITAMTTLVNTTNATFPGVKIIFGQSSTNAYGFPTPVTFNKPVQIEGIGGGHTTDTGDYTRIGGTRLAWWGTSFDGGTDFGAFFTVSPTGVQSLKRVSFSNLWLDCRNGDQNQALFGLKLASCHGFMLDKGFFVMDALAGGLWTDIDSDPTEAKDTTRFTIRDACFRQLDNPNVSMTVPILMVTAAVLTTSPQTLTVAANTLPTSGYLWTATNIGSPVLVKYTGGGGTILLTGCTIASEMVIHTPTTVTGGNVVQAVPGNGMAILFNGGQAANTCCGVVDMVQVSHGGTWGPAGMELWNSDSIQFRQLMMNGGIATNDGAINRIRKPGVRLNGSSVTSTLASRNNVFDDGDPGIGGVCAMGVSSTGSRLLAQSGPTYWDLHQLGNGAPSPIIEGDASFNWTPNGGYLNGGIGTDTVANQALVAATLTSITGSLVAVPPQGLRIGTAFRWTICGTKTAVGTAASTFHVRLGTTGGTGDTAIATAAGTVLGTAATGAFMVICILTIRTIGSGAAGTAVCTVSIIGNGATGFVINSSSINATMATFDTTLNQLFLSMSCTSGATVVPTFSQCISECINPANP